jgi:hypothetical protein
VASAPGILGGAEVPAWPDFAVEEVAPERYGQRGDWFIWRASTDTKRPGTPIFSVWVAQAHRLSAAEARELLGIRLREEYEKAHPNGCGSR